MTIWEIPDDDDALVAVIAMCEQLPDEWTLISVKIGFEEGDLLVQRPPSCPRCGKPMEFSEELQEFVCSHPA